MNNESTLYKITGVTPADKNMLLGCIVTKLEKVFVGEPAVFNVIFSNGRAVTVKTSSVRKVKAQGNALIISTANTTYVLQEM